MNRPGIVSALPAEARTLTRRRLVVGEPVGLPAGALVLVCGMGPKRARQAAKALLNSGAGSLVSWGAAGGLDPALAPGDLVLPEAVLSPTGLTFQAEAAWLDRLRGRAKSVVRTCEGTLAGSTQALAKPEEKARVFRQTRAAAVDMESFAIAEVAREQGIPFLAIRAVADAAETELPRCVAAAVQGEGRIRLLDLGVALLKRPADLPGVLRLAGQFRAAMKTLRVIAGLAGPTLLAP